MAFKNLRRLHRSEWDVFLSPSLHMASKVPEEPPTISKHLRLELEEAIEDPKFADQEIWSQSCKYHQMMFFVVERPSCMNIHDWNPEQPVYGCLGFQVVTKFFIVLSDGQCENPRKKQTPLNLSTLKIGTVCFRWVGVTRVTKEAFLETF